MNAIKTYKNGNSQSTIDQARSIKAQLGIRSAAGFLRNRGWSVEGCLFVLLGEMIMYNVIESRTGLIKGTYKTIRAANNARDRLDNAVGAYRYTVRCVQPVGVAS